MICSSCSKLSSIATKKQCKKCKTDIYSNIAVICNSCSDKNNICAYCLKKLLSDSKLRPKGCFSCGNK